MDIAASKVAKQSLRDRRSSAEPARSPPPDRRKPFLVKDFWSGAARERPTKPEGRRTSQLSARRGHERCFCKDEEVRLVADGLPLEAKEPHDRKTERDQARGTHPGRGVPRGKEGPTIGRRITERGSSRGGAVPKVPGQAANVGQLERSGGTFLLAFLVYKDWSPLPVSTPFCVYGGSGF